MFTSSPPSSRYAGLRRIALGYQIKNLDRERRISPSPLDEIPAETIYWQPQLQINYNEIKN
ncbi:MAG: hypothetical protein CO003_00275 [Candidatus Portnoybacteria bacterium CG_4_8_14_3_um_filter_44_15]|uniref:Uncharacterized protein n=2 Tax=Candidatus Portnoyibacteriota TaxID=1817913 RepID=A0A2H0KW77_9BACT|nr:MAG: hypothetical protein COV84_00620 [Candidatus Portnoybacteria bacterium CG11_big_fil_rev_8_21_14_0_20_40_15]PIW74888.1 MAG: hypothetical protein CO003_00275 [Candidatus Portnoybacteria bacterium CG_4_8_14_3_um_filter_44_15]